MPQDHRRAVPAPLDRWGTPQVPTVLTDHSIQVTNRTRDHHTFQPIFVRVCQELGIASPTPTISGLMGQP
jgi:hypothetical protein